MTSGLDASTARRGSVSYADVGVDATRQSGALEKVFSRIRRTWPPGGGIGAVKLDVGYFANVIDLGSTWLAISTDGVGTKAILASMMERYDTIGIDCVAMNVNDVLCVGADPISLVDYVAIESARPDVMDAITQGLCAGAEIAGVSITGGETAEVPEMLTSHGPGVSFDLAATAVGIIEPDRLIVGQVMKPDDVVLGVRSNGIHSNGLTLARHVLFERSGFSVDTVLQPLPGTIGEELLRPTYIYVPEVRALKAAGIAPKALIHVTSDGFLNLTRVVSDVGYIIDTLPPVPAVFELIQQYGNVSDEEMFHVYNMGIGFCVVVAPEDVADATVALASKGKDVYRIGRVTDDPRRRVRIPAHELVGEKGRFRKV